MADDNPYAKFATAAAPADDNPYAKFSGKTAKVAPTAGESPVRPPLTGGSVWNPANQQFGLMEMLANMGSGMIAKPVSDVAGLAAAGREMIAPSGEKADPQGFQRQIQESMTYQPRTEMGHAMTEYNPMALLAKLVQMGSGKARELVAPPGSGPVREGVGRAVEEGLNQAPGFVGAKGGAPAVQAASAGLKDAARSTMQSALKPPIDALRSGKAATAVDTLLDQGVNVSKGGVAKLRDRMEVLDDRVGQIIDGSPAIIDKHAVASTLQDLTKQFEKQVNPMTDVRTIQKAYDEFLAHPMINGNGIPIKQAQDMKRATYKSLGDKAYGELKGAEIEAQKTLARGLKEEIAKAVPEVQPLNAEMSKLATTLSLTERRALMEANKNPIGLGILSLNPAHLAAWLADRSGVFKSIVARMLNSTSEALPPLGAAAPALGAVQQGQIEPPPHP